MDAVREQCLSDEGTPSPQGWSQISHKMRRAAALRRSIMAVAVLVPVSALLLWSPWRQGSLPEVLEPAPIAVNDISYEFIEPAVVPEATPLTPRPIPVFRPKPASVVKLEAVDLPVTQEVPPALSDTVSVKESSPSSGRRDAEESSGVTFDPFESLSARQPGLRPRLSVGVKAGTGTARRDASVRLQSAPYMAALAYMNAYPIARDPMATSGVKANTSNTVGLSSEAKQFIPEFSTDLYHHDLPVSLGVTFRMDLNSRVGVESGIDYTYLHSSVESLGGKLDQRLHFIGIPLRLDARLLSRGRLDLYAGIGVKAEKCVAASFGTVRCEERRLQWSAGAFAGVQYGLWNRTHLFFQPELSYYVTGTDLLTYRTEHPLTFTLQAGLRFDL